ncbi:MAG: mechanosensitive ion channel family protein [Candidatus Sulfobium sp.]
MGNWVLTSGLRLVLIFVLTAVALKAARIISRRVVAMVSAGRTDSEALKRSETLGSVIRHALTIVIFIVAVMMALKEFGVDIGPVIAAAGVVGVAVGFGAQNLVKDVISGFFILLEDQIRVGDVVEIAGKAGLVEKVNLRMTILRDLSGNVHYVRNGHIDVVTNMTKEYSFYVFEIGVAYRENVDEVIKVVREVDEELRRDPQYRDDILEPLEVLGLDKFGDSAVIIKARTKTLPVKQWGVGREFNRRMKIKFDEKNIEIPFPHITLYIGKDKEGKSPPLDISLIRGNDDTLAESEKT